MIYYLQSTVNFYILFGYTKTKHDSYTMLELLRSVHSFKPNFISGKPAITFNSVVRVMTSVLENYGLHFPVHNCSPCFT